MLFKASPLNLQKQLFDLNLFNSRPDQEGTTRVWFSDEEIKARNYIKDLMISNGLTVTEDAIGNIFGTLEGSEKELAPVWSGSHIDTVLNAGMYDGMVGVLAAIEACRLIKQSGIPHRRSITAIVFSSEEPTRFGIGCVGSRTMAGHLSLEDTKNIIDDDGITLYDTLEKLEYTKKNFNEIVKHKGDVFASVELHIEQADILERLQIPIGIVEGICAPSYIHVSVEGEQKHAGSTPMNERKDSLCAASEIILEIEKIAKSYGNIHTVGTVGKINVFPNAQNVISGNSSFTIDIRDIDMDVKTNIINKISTFINNISKKRKVKITYEVTTDDIPRKSNKTIVKVIEQSCKRLKIPYHNMISGAYHDSLLVAEFAPMAMIFVPSKDGVSHDPSEYTDIEEITKGTDVLTDVLINLSNMDQL